MLKKKSTKLICFFFSVSENSNASKKSHQSQLNKTSNKKKVWDKRGKDGKQSFNHQWLLTSLKGHTSEILDMEFSPNGKFLATCGEGKLKFKSNKFSTQ